MGSIVSSKKKKLPQPPAPETDPSTGRPTNSGPSNNQSVNSDKSAPIKQTSRPPARPMNNNQPKKNSVIVVDEVKPPVSVCILHPSFNTPGNLHLQMLNFTRDGVLFPIC